MLVVDPVDGGVARIIGFLEDLENHLSLQRVVVVREIRDMICNYVASCPVSVNHVGVTLSSETVLTSGDVER